MVGGLGAAEVLDAPNCQLLDYLQNSGLQYRCFLSLRGPDFSCYSIFFTMTHNF
jgi:hypothetical protein